jgi:glucosamine--fructose-6-phosphate aminotransferase (isomerizing)
MTLKENELARITSSGVEIFNFTKNDSTMEKVKLKEGISHYFIQEMLEQPEAVQKCLGFGGRLKGSEPGMVKLGGLDNDEPELINIENLLIAACGTSYYASLYGSLLMREFGCFNMIEVKIASEIQEKDFPVRNGGLLCVSQSGETTDLLKPFREAEELGLKRFNIVNNVESTLAREAKCGVFVNAGKESSIASTKAYLCQVIAFSLITIWFASRVNYKHSKQRRIKLWSELNTLSEKVKQVVTSVTPFAKACAHHLKDEAHIFLLGLGLGECTAREDP